MHKMVNCIKTHTYVDANGCAVRINRLSNLFQFTYQIMGRIYAPPVLMLSTENNLPICKKNHFHQNVRAHPKPTRFLIAFNPTHTIKKIDLFAYQNYFFSRSKIELTFFNG